jgi:hypothetical protein
MHHIDRRASTRDTSRWRRDSYLLDYVAGRDPAHRPFVLRSDPRWAAHRLIDLAGGDPMLARRALDDAVAERVSWARGRAS